MTTASRQELAYALHLSPRRVAELIANGDLPKPVRRSTYDLIKSTRAYVVFLRSSQQALSHERARLTKARADREELNLRVRSGELVEAVTIQRQAFAAGRQVRDSLQALPDRLAGIISAESDQMRCHAILSKEIRQALEALADTSI